MARKAFYSFHYELDNARAAQIRNIGVIESNVSASDNDWETITRGGDNTVKKWIDNQLCGCSCAIVLIGEQTAGRKWIEYEIKKSWNDKKGILGIHIHNLKNLNGEQAGKGNNPFDAFTMERDGTTKLSSIVKTYNPPYNNSKDVYRYISEHLAAWIEEAIYIRDNY